jgi:fission 1 protein
MTEQLPVIDHETVTLMLSEYEAIFLSGRSQKEADNARIRLIFALVHSKLPKHQERGRNLALAQLARSDASEQDQGELRYLAAVASFNMRRFVEARRELEMLMETGEEMRQAKVLKGLVEEAIVRDGLIGFGAIAAGIAGVVLAAALSRRK